MNSNMMMMLMLMAPSLLGQITSLFNPSSGATSSLSSMLPLIMMTGGMKGSNTGMMMTLMTGNPIFMLMGNNTTRRRTKKVYIYRNSYRRYR